MGGPASLTAFAAALAPAAVLSIWLWVVDRGRTTSELLGQSLTLGALMAPAVLLPAWIFDWTVGEAASSFGHGQLGPYLIGAAINAPLLEEAGRLCIVVFVLARHEDFRPDRFVAVAGWVSLGFAGVENTAYLVLEQEWGVLAMLRATTTVPTHLVLGLAMGAFLAAHARTGRRSLLLSAYGVPAGLHSVYNATAILTAHREEIISGIGFLAVLLVLGAVATKSVGTIGPADDGSDSRRRDRVVAYALGWSLMLGGVLTVGASILVWVWEADPFGRGLVFLSAPAVLPVALGITAVRSARRIANLSPRGRCADNVG
jgi:RsiW-degrading membrane proteinase PrsW (M82 family)